MPLFSREVVAVQLVGFLEQVGTNCLAILSHGTLRAGESHRQSVQAAVAENP